MNMRQNPWDILSKRSFNTHLKEGEIDPRAADNILLAWPPIINLITRHYQNSNNIRVLDFGCGSGGFCIKLDKLGFDVTGIDPSSEMIMTAKNNSPKTIHYITGDYSDLHSFDKFQVITSIMTFPFIEDIKSVINSLNQILHTNGLLVFADFNRGWVKACLKAQVSFADFDSVDFPSNGLKTFGDIKIPVKIRDVSEYDNMAKQNKLIKVMEEYPPFTQGFINKYPDNRPKDIPEYMILGYKKGAS